MKNYRQHSGPHTEEAFQMKLEETICQVNADTKLSTLTLINIDQLKVQALNSSSNLILINAHLQKRGQLTILIKGSP
ncbi:hypothetical protein FGO68_gene2586 [Halteria grandinella]|uniref:Uncharacterized protein n=1 Tax=Halteria grandinella TaxID=5974 RepID=A0A8J8NG66_HALGN|nr:hypothetical protein FGO68_gene2586 [Halteria grandinella]